MLFDGVTVYFILVNDEKLVSSVLVVVLAFESVHYILLVGLWYFTFLSVPLLC